MICSLEHLSPIRQKQLKKCCDKISYEFKNIELLNKAFIHTSFANEKGLSHTESNQRLEFLGDAVLELLISEEIYMKYPSFNEGEMTKIRAAVVCEPTLAKKANKLGFGDNLLLGKGEEITGGRSRNSILADTFEAVVGAVYLDGGPIKAREFVRSQLLKEIEYFANAENIMDYKTSLQELLQKESSSKIQYDVIEEKGPDHNKVFFVSVKVGDKVLGYGNGKSKKEAEQVAAQEALNKLKN